MLRMRVLLIEDDQTIIEIFDSEAASGQFELTHVANRTDALMVLADGSFHLIVCDLKIPPSRNSFDGDTAHGQAVLTEIIETHKGTPVIAFSAHATMPVMQQLLERARESDYLGVNVAAPMISFFQKDQITECLCKVHEIQSSMAELDAIQIATGMHLLSLSWEQERVLRIYARRIGATVVKVSPMGGGRSQATVLRLRLFSNGAQLANVVVKLDALDSVLAESECVEKFVSPALLSGSYPSNVSLVSAGASRCGGVFYRFAGGYDEPLMSLVNRPNAGEVVAKVRGILDPWGDGAPVKEVTLEAVREILVCRAAAPQTILESAASAEASILPSRWCTSHCDLHVFNVLVSADEAPMIIDFGSVQAAPPSIDPITLELSLFFHPDSREILGAEWPTAEQAEHWDNLKVYLEGCPAPEFVTACHEWAFDVGAGDQDVFASLYAYAMRQFRYDPVGHAVAAGLVQCALRRLAL